MTQRLAILPFSVDSEKLQFLSESIQDLLMRELGISQKYMVISKQSTALASEQSDDIYKIGKQLDAIRLIEGLVGHPRPDANAEAFVRCVTGVVIPTLGTGR